MVRVVVVDRRPDERAAKVLLHLRHELAGERLKVDVTAVLRRDDESKLALLALQRLGETGLVERPVGAIEVPRRPISLNTVAFEVGEVETGRVPPAAAHRNERSFTTQRREFSRPRPTSYGLTRPSPDRAALRLVTRCASPRPRRPAIRGLKRKTGSRRSSSLLAIATGVSANRSKNVPQNHFSVGDGVISATQKPSVL